MGERNGDRQGVARTRGAAEEAGSVTHRGPDTCALGPEFLPPVSGDVWGPGLVPGQVLLSQD